MKFLGVFLFVLGLITLMTYREIPLINGYSGSILGFFLIAIGSSLIREGKREEQPSLEEKLNTDDRASVLILRSFKRDQSFLERPESLKDWLIFHPEHYKSRTGETFEELLTKKFEKIGPVIALGTPNEKLQPLGASRAYFSHKEWKEKILELIANSQYVIIMLDFSDSVIWEFQQTVKSKRLANILIITPPISLFFEEKEKEKWSNKYIDFAQEYSFMPRKLPQNCFAIGFDDKDKFKTYISLKSKPYQQIEDFDMIITDYLLKSTKDIKDEF